MITLVDKFRKNVFDLQSNLNTNVQYDKSEDL